MYLKEVCEDSSNKIEELRSEDRNAVLPRHLANKLSHENKEQSERLNEKLRQLCANSAWNSAGRVDLVNNLSDKRLSNVETQALAIGLKFNTGKNYREYIEYINRHYRWKERDMDKGFKQGIVTFSSASK